MHNATSTPMARARILSALRALALFIGVFSALNLLAQLRTRGFDANRWWIDFRPLPAWLGGALLALLAAALIAWAIRPIAGRARCCASSIILLITIATAAFNVIAFYRLRVAGFIATPMPIPFSMIVLLAMGAILRTSISSPVAPALIEWRWASAAMIMCAGGFPLAQIACYGWTDYRRPADAIVVFGARAYADGEPSDALADRTLTAIDLYQHGFAPRLIFSGGPGDGAQREVDVMKRLAMEHGVPESSIILDPAGLTTEATVRNAKSILPGGRLLVVSHGWHLPRAKLRFEREGMIAYTVPANERGQPLRQTPYLIAREVAALWVYYLRAVAI